MNMAVWGLNQPSPMYAPNFAPGTLICFFTSQNLSETKILPLRNNKKYMCNMSQVAPSWLHIWLISEIRPKLKKNSFLAKNDHILGSGSMRELSQVSKL